MKRKEEDIFFSEKGVKKKMVFNWKVSKPFSHTLTPLRGSGVILTFQNNTFGRSSLAQQRVTDTFRGIKQSPPKYVMLPLPK